MELSDIESPRIVQLNARKVFIGFQKPRDNED